MRPTLSNLIQTPIPPEFIGIQQIMIFLGATHNEPDSVSPVMKLDD